MYNIFKINYLRIYESPTQTVQGIETHGGDSSEDAAKDEIHDGALDHVDEEGAAAGEDHREAEEELPAQLVHVEDGPEVAGEGGQRHDEAVDEDLVLGNVERAVHEVVLPVPGGGGHLLGHDLAHGLGGVGELLVVLLQLVEQLREPVPEAVVAELDGEVDHEHDHGHPPQRARQQLPQGPKYLHKALS